MTAAPAGNPRTTGEITRRTFTFAELGRTYRKLVRGEIKPPPTSRLAKLARKWRNGEQYEFYGATGEEMIGYLDNGYDFPATDLDLAPATYDGNRRAWRWNPDDGDYEHEVWLGGDEDCYLDHSPLPQRLGILVRVHTGFPGNVNADVIADYGRWVGSLLESLNAAGYDVALEIAKANRHCYTDETISEYSVRVADFGEDLLPRDYGVLFTRGGYRHLLFTLICLPELHEGKRARNGLGTPIRTDWGVEFDDETRVLNVTVGEVGGEPFPKDRMDKSVAELAARL